MKRKMVSSNLRKGGGAVLAIGLVAALASACGQGRNAEDPSSQQNQYPQQQPNGQQPSGQQPNGQQPYGQPPAGQSPQQAPQKPSGAAQSGASQALPCQSDTVCGTHRCNTQTGRCAFPCASDADCMPGFSCAAGIGLCVPGAVQ